MKTLIFAEKPSVGRDIAGILRAGRSGKGYLEGESHVVTWGIGHLAAIGHPEVQNPDWKRWSLANLPMIPSQWRLVVLPQTKDQFEVVKKLMNREDIDMIVNAADAGREGELIFRLVYRLSGCSKPFKRLWISSMTDEAIREGFAGLRPGAQYDALAEAAECRSRADWLVGINLTRCYTKKFGEMLTIGRVQTPTLAMIVARQNEITDFKPRDYREIVADFGDFKAVWFDPHEKDSPTRIFDHSKALALCEMLKGKTALVNKFETAKKKQPPPFLYDLTSLQREANAKFGLTAAQTLSAAQNLYEKRKVITYPRTDSRFLSSDLFQTIGSRFKALPHEYDEFTAMITAQHPVKTKRVFDDSKVSDHHAIIPNEKNPGRIESWNNDERQVYDLVVRRFLAVFLPDFQYLSTAILMKSEGHFFKAGGSVPLIEGWKLVYRHAGEMSEAGDDKQQSEEERQLLPKLEKGEKRLIKALDLRTRKTRPPPHHTEATLLQSMETAGKLIEDEELREAMKDSGLGTPATRAEIIEKLIRVGYLYREKKKLLPTPKGIQLIRLISAEMASPELTGSWEKRLSLMAKAMESSATFMKDICEFVTKQVATVKDSRTSGVTWAKTGTANTVKSSAKPSDKRSGTVQNSPIPARKTFGICPACGKGNIIEGKRGFGCDRFKEGCSYVVWKEFHGKKLSKSAIDSLIAGKPTREAGGFTLQDGTKVKGRIRMREDKKGIELIVNRKDVKD